MGRRKRENGLVKLFDTTKLIWMDEFERGTAYELVGLEAWIGG